MSSGWIEFGIILILVLLNGLFALAEMAIVAAKRVRLKQNIESGRPGAEAALDLAENSGVFLSTVQLGITLVGVAAGAFGGSTLSGHISPLISQIPALQSSSEAISFGLVVLLITYLSLVLGELVPKTLAMSNPEKYARQLAPLMKTLSRLGRPLVRLLDGSTKGVIRVLGIKMPKRQPVTDEDLRMLIDQGALSGVLNRKEEVMMEQVLNMDKSRIESLITPRSQIIWLDFNASQKEIRQTLVNHKRSKYPVALGQLDQLRGVVYAQELLEQHLTTGHFDIPAILHQPVVVPESLNILETIDRLTITQSGIAFVLNEFGGIDGLIADDDLTEALIGFKAGSHPTTDPAIVKREDGSWLVDGLLPLTRFRELVGKKPLSDDERLYQTLGGLIMTELGKIPSSGDSLTWEDVHLEVVDMDGNRVDKVIAHLT